MGDDPAYRPNLLIGRRLRPQLVEIEHEPALTETITHCHGAFSFATCSLLRPRVGRLLPW